MSSSKSFSNKKVWKAIFETPEERALKELSKCRIKAYLCESCGHQWRRKWSSFVACPKCKSPMVMYRNFLVWEWNNI